MAVESLINRIRYEPDNIPYTTFADCGTERGTIMIAQGCIRSLNY